MAKGVGGVWRGARRCLRLREGGHDEVSKDINERCEEQRSGNPEISTKRANVDDFQGA